MGGHTQELGITTVVDLSKFVISVVASVVVLNFSKRFRPCELQKFWILVVYEDFTFNAGSCYCILF